MIESTQPPIAVISGGGGYIGGAVAKKLSENGWKIALLYHHTVGNLSALTGQGHRAYQCDLRQEKDVDTTIEKIVHDFEAPIDACIHAAESKMNRSNIKDLHSAEFMEQFAVGVCGGFNLFKAVARHIKRGGIIIGITSVYAGELAYASKIGAYIPAKFALRGLLKVFSKELAQDNIRVYAVAPSFLPSGMNSDLPPAVAKLIYEKSKNGNMATIENVSNIISYLCSPAAEDLGGFSISVSSGEKTLL